MGRREREATRNFGINGRKTRARNVPPSPFLSFPFPSRVFPMCFPYVTYAGQGVAGPAALVVGQRSVPDVLHRAVVQPVGAFFAPVLHDPHARPQPRGQVGAAVLQHLTLADLCDQPNVALCRSEKNGGGKKISKTYACALCVLGRRAAYDVGLVVGEVGQVEELP